MLIYTTCQNFEQAEKISEILLKEKLIACANMTQIKSVYFWKNELKKETEVALLLKTNAKYAKLIEQRIKKLHSYDVPAILRIEAKSTKEFEKWINETIK